MLNSAEENSYWYLRLNGFFLIDNFVIHKSENINYSADSDLLAIRTPFVFEQIGGQPDDWDVDLFHYLGVEEPRLIGIICQVKGGQLRGNLFGEPYLSYSIERLGLAGDVTGIIDQLNNGPTATITNELGYQCTIAKLLITRDSPPANPNYLWVTLEHIYTFIDQRINKYSKHKYRDRGFFSSLAFQTLIERNEIQRRQNE